MTTPPVSSAGSRPSDDDDPFFAPDYTPPAAPPTRRSRIKEGVGVALILTLCIGGRLAIRAMNAAADAPPAPPPVPAPVVPIADSPLPVVAAKAPIFAVGQCLSMINAAALAPRSSILACGYQHVGEVFAVIPVDGANYTGIDELFALRDECSASLTAYADPAKIEGMTVYTLSPTAGSWQLGDHTAYCADGGEGGDPTTGSVRKKKS